MKFTMSVWRSFGMLCIALASCTTEQAYHSGQGWQHNECAKIVDRAEYERCMQSTNTSYADYKRQTKDGKQY